MNRSTRRVLFAGTWDSGAGYPRTRALIEGLESRGIKVDQVCVPLPNVGESKSRLLRSPWRWPGFALGMWRARRELLARTRAALANFQYDAVIVPYPGHAAVRWLRPVVSQPLILDMFLSAHGTVVEDRGLFRAGSLAARYFLRLDRLACEAADLVLLDTPQHIDYVSALTGRSPAGFDWIPISVPETEAHDSRARDSAQPLELLFFGTGVRLHGLSTLCDAVATVDSVRLTLVGGTPEERAHAERVIPADRLVLGDTFEAPSSIRERLSSCDLVAGVFGGSEKAALVVPFKLVHALEAQRPVLTADTSAVRELLQPGVDCLVCARDDVAALAESMRTLANENDLLVDIAVAGRARYDSTFSTRAVGERLEGVLERVVGSRGSR